MTTASDALSALTVMLNDPMNGLDGPVTPRCVATEATFMFALPLIAPDVAVTDCAPGVVSVTLKVCTPLSPAMNV